MSSRNPIDVILTPEEIDRCKSGADIKSLSSLNLINNRKSSSHSDWDIDFLGLRGEAAFGKAYGLEVNWDSVAPDAGYDFLIGDTKIEVRTTFKSDMDLRVRLKKGFRAHVYVLISATGRPHRMRIHGGSTPKLIREKGEKTNDSWLMPQHHLHPPQSLWRLFTAKQAKWDNVEWEARVV